AVDSAVGDVVRLVRTLPRRLLESSTVTAHRATRPPVRSPQRRPACATTRRDLTQELKPRADYSCSLPPRSLARRAAAFRRLTLASFVKCSMALRSSQFALV